MAFAPLQFSLMHPPIEKSLPKKPIPPSYTHNKSAIYLPRLFNVSIRWLVFSEHGTVNSQQEIKAREKFDLIGPTNRSPHRAISEAVNPRGFFVLFCFAPEQAGWGPRVLSTGRVTIPKSRGEGPLNCFIRRCKVRM